MSGISAEAYTDMERVILRRSNISSIRIHIAATVRDRRHQSVSRLREPVHCAAISQAKTLEAKADSEDWQYVLIREVP